jgi:hypothetical protein
MFGPLLGFPSIPASEGLPSMELPGSGPTYEGARIALLTRHGKERALGPPLEGRLGAVLAVVDDFDTDALGTFSQLEAARRKARIALERSDAPLGLGSEGAFFPGPFGLVPWNLEVLAFVDRVRDIEVVGRAQGPGLHVHGPASSREELAGIAGRAGFPGHGLVIRPDGPDDPRIRKGIADPDTLHAAFEAARRESASGTVFVENDLRAHFHPTRMAMIGRAGLDLAERLAAACPGCGCPGFGRSGVEPGLPCAACGTPTGEPLADLLACVRCDRRERRVRPGPEVADPARCPHCNP